MNDETQRALPPPAPAAADPADRAAETADDESAPAPHAETLAQTPTQAARAIGAVPPPGKVFVPGYEVLGELGRGGMGVVYRARHLKLNRVVALKMVLGAQHADSRELARFVAEAQAVAEIKHPNVIQVFDSGEADGHPFMAMECLEGGSLSQRLRAAGKMEPEAAAELLIKVARGVQAAHDRGIVHRDLKPHNVLLDAPPANAPPDAWGEPKVMDFGLAKRGGAELTQTGAVMGTPAYMSPEQAKGETKNIGPAADVYALGVILYECLCGSVPFTGGDAWSVIRQVVEQEPEPVTRRIRGVPRDLDLICRKCLAKEPAERYATAAALADDLQRFLNGEALRGPRTGIWYAGRKAARRWWRPVAAAGALVALLVAAWLLPSPLDWLRGKKKPDEPKEDAITASSAAAVPVVPLPAKPDEPKEDAVTALLREEVSNQVAGLRRTKPVPDRESPHPLARLGKLPDTDYSRFKVYKDERVVDMRGWRQLPATDPAAECSIVYFTRREMMKVEPTDELRIETRTTGRDVVNRALRPNAEKARTFATDVPGFVGRQPMKVRHLVFDVRDIPVNHEFTLRYTSTFWNSLQTDDDRWFGVIGYEGSVKTSMLILFPEDRPFHDYQLRYAPTRVDDPTKREDPRAYTGPLIALAAGDKSWLYWEIPNPKANHVYRVDWTW